MALKSFNLMATPRKALQIFKTWLTTEILQDRLLVRSRLEFSSRRCKSISLIISELNYSVKVSKEGNSIWIRRALPRTSWENRLRYQNHLSCQPMQNRRPTFSIYNLSQDRKWFRQTPGKLQAKVLKITWDKTQMLRHMSKEWKWWKAIEAWIDQEITLNMGEQCKGSIMIVHA